MGQGTRMILDFVPLRCLEAPTSLSYNLGWCYFPPSLIPSPTNVHKIPEQSVYKCAQNTMQSVYSKD